MDAGDILLQREEPIHPEDTSATLGARLASIGAALFVEALGLVASGEALFTPQDESKVVRCRLFEKSDGQIEWDRPARAIHNLVRAAAPWPVAHSPLKGEMLRIHRTEVLDRAAATPPGTVEAVETDRLVVGTGEGVLALLEVQAPGKKTMPVSDFLRGRKIEPGDRFGDP